MKLVSRVQRDAFLYLDPKEPKNEFAQCSTCIKFTGSTCLILGKNIPVTGNMSCGFYLNGEPNLKAKGSEEEIVTPKEAGLVNRKVRCENCKFFKEKESICDLYHDLNRDYPEKFNLDEKVNKYGCCNAESPK